MLKKILVKEIYLPIIYIGIGIVIYTAISKLISLSIYKNQKKFDQDSYSYKKIQTFKTLFKNIIKVIDIIFVILAILSVYGINISTILAGFGIIGAVIGLAFQDIIKDFLGGLTIILENQFALGDTIEVGGFKGEVISIGLKTTRLKNYEGFIKIIANRNISEIINYSAGNSRAIVDISVSYESDLNKVEEVLNNLAEQFTNTLENIKGKVQLLGVESLSNSSIVYRMTVETKSMEHFNIQRKMKKEIKLRLDKENIKIPYDQIEVHNGK